MNFNLISPENEAHNFTVRYNEPIVVPANANVYLNWATFERDNVIQFTEDQTFTYVFDETLPKWNYDPNGMTKIAGKSQTYTIKSGTYTVSELQDQICVQQVKAGQIICDFNPTNRNITGLDEDDVGVLVPDGNVQLEGYDLVTPNLDMNANYLSLGFMTNNGTITKLEGNNRNAITNVPHQKNANGGIGSYVATADGTPTNEYYGNSYILDNLFKYKHINQDLNTFNSTATGGAFNGRICGNNFDELRHGAMVTAIPNTKIGDIVGKIFIGLYNEQIADGLIDGTVGAGGKTHGAVMITEDVTGGVDGGATIPQGWGGIEVSATHFTVYAKQCYNYDDITQPAKAFTYEWAGLSMPNSAKPKVFFQTYYADEDILSADTFSNENAETLFVRAGLINDSNMAVILYDSNWYNTTFDWSFDKEFMDEYGQGDTAPPNVLHSKASIPFNIQMCATANGEGWEHFDYTPQKATNTDAKPPIMVKQYHMEMSRQLGNLFTPSKEVSVVFDSKQPTSVTMTNAKNKLGGSFYTLNNNANQYFYQFNNLVNQFRYDRFVVLLNGLPIKAYKNTTDKSKSGMRKSILANIPNPFSGADLIGTDLGQYAERILGSYVSSMGVVNQLNNQQFTTNNFNIQVLNMDDETPADQLNKVVINFTIQAE